MRTNRQVEEFFMNMHPLWDDANVLAAERNFFRMRQSRHCTMVSIDTHESIVSPGVRFASANERC